jgi:hypothetical protein
MNIRPQAKRNPRGGRFRVSARPGVRLKSFGSLRRALQPSDPGKRPGAIPARFGRASAPLQSKLICGKAVNRKTSGQFL